MGGHLEGRGLLGFCCHNSAYLAAIGICGHIVSQVPQVQKDPYNYSLITAVNKTPSLPSNHSATQEIHAMKHINHPHQRVREREDP